MTREEFVKLRQKDWDRFEALLSFAEGKRTPQWSGEDVSEFSALFRAICYDLSLVRSRDFGLALSRYLNNLATRGHNTFYRTPPGSFQSVVRFFSHHFPWLLRKHIGYFWLSLALFVLPGLVAGILLATNPDLGARLFSEDQLAAYQEMHSGRISGTDVETANGTGNGDASAPLFMTSFYIQNNIGIAFKCFASGALLGIGTVCHLVQNSLAIGGITGYLVARGNAWPFFTFVISHGSFELTAIVVAGAAGLVLGRSMIHPGGMTRRDSLKVRGRVAVKLALGAGGMLAIAAVIEGFWSPSPAPRPAKFIVGTILWIIVIAYLSLAGRGYDPAHDVEVGGVDAA